jgi:Fe-S-cluster containining protein
MDVEESTPGIVNDERDLPAGDFSCWLRRVRNALRHGTGMDVACGECVGCCTSSYFIHIEPGETATLGRIRKELLVVAPGLPKRHVLLGYDSNGRCPMFANGKCSIYEDRPQTCRSYDCRVFTAAGILPGGPDKVEINERARRWRFTYPAEQDREEHLAVQAAASFIREHADSFPGRRVPTDPSQLAILAIKTYEVFLDLERGGSGPGEDRSDAEVARAVVAMCKRFDSGMVAEERNGR